MKNESLKVLAVGGPPSLRETIARELKKTLPPGSLVETANDASLVHIVLRRFSADVLLIIAAPPKAGTSDYIRQLIAEFNLPILVICDDSRCSAEAALAGANTFTIGLDEKNNIDSQYIERLVLRLRLTAMVKPRRNFDGGSDKVAKSGITVSSGSVFTAPSPSRWAGAAKVSAHKVASPLDTVAKSGIKASPGSVFTAPSAYRWAGAASNSEHKADSPLDTVAKSGIKASPGSVFTAPSPSRWTGATDVAEKKAASPLDSIAKGGTAASSGSLFSSSAAAPRKDSIGPEVQSTASPLDRIAKSGISANTSSVFTASPLPRQAGATAPETRTAASPLDAVAKSGISASAGSVFTAPPAVRRPITAEAEAQKTSSPLDTVAKSGIKASPGSIFVAAAKPPIIPPVIAAPAGRAPKCTLIAIGASTGGTEAIGDLILAMHPPLPPIVIVQHIPPHFSQMFSERLDESCLMKVKEAATGDRIENNCVYIAPGGKHMRLKQAGDGYELDCQPGPLINSVCPSVDVLFDTVAEFFGAEAIGVILTGIGRDGASGLLKMRLAGARTLGQNPASCVVYGMPKVAWEIGAVERQMPLADMAEELMKMANGR